MQVFHEVIVEFKTMWMIMGGERYGTLPLGWARIQMGWMRRERDFLKANQASRTHKA